MNEAAPTVAELQADALVQEIERKVAEQQRELLEAARSEAEAIRQRARVKARRQLRRAIDEMRAVERQRTQQLRSELETAQRREASVQALAALALAWPRLGDAVARRWHDPAARRLWIAAQLAQARARLPRAGWVLRHPLAWGADDVAVLRDLLGPGSPGVADARVVSDPQVPAGLVIEVGGVRLDSTPPALLADRVRVEAALLAALVRVAGVSSVSGVPGAGGVVGAQGPM